MIAGRYVVLTLSEQLFGIEVHKIREVLSFRKMTPLPETRQFARGLISLRGVPLPVFELREQLQLPINDYSRFHVIIVVEAAGKLMGVIADEISEVLEIIPEEIQTIDSVSLGLRPEYLTGVGKQGNKMIFLLNLEYLLNDGKMKGEQDYGQDSGNRRQQVDWSYCDDITGQTGA